MGALDIDANDLVPAEARLAMPKQNLKVWQRGRQRTISSGSATLARLFVFTTTVLLAGYGTWQMYQVVGQSNATSLQVLLVALFGLAFSWIALAAATAILGFISVVANGAGLIDEKRPARLWTRTAIVMPIYNEDTDTVFYALTRMGMELASAGQGAHFDIFVLSDSTEVETIRRERDAAIQLQLMLEGRIGVHYRKRASNEGRKAGNVADFVARWGAAYDFMIVLDADSYMTPDSIVALVSAMQRDERAGLIQTVPQLANGTTLFARMQQFAAATYGPVLATGLALWHARDGNYWGHNAIIRVRAFASACGLPELEGGAPFGGHIMSHDFVEAALLRRAGYAVYLRPDIGGSFEGTPPTLAEHAARDRRWAQGNLQHSKIVPAAGLHWMSRFHLINGIMSYVASPLWLMFLATGIALSWVAVSVQPDYFPSDFALFPTWPRFDAQQALTLLGVSGLVLLVPKILAWLAVLGDARKRRDAGGAFALTNSVICETLFSTLLAPILMLMQTRFVVDVLLGRDAGWVSQQRRERDAPLWVIARHHLGHTLTGVALSLGTFTLSVQVWLWLLPVWLGLSLAIPLVYLTSQGAVGMFAHRAGLFLVAGETEESDVPGSGARLIAPGI